MRMTVNFVGQTADLGVTVEGRGSLGIATEEDLAAGVNANLAVDKLADLAVVEAVTWTGMSAAKTVQFASGTGGAAARSEA
jgi:hypothetical protein